MEDRFLLFVWCLDPDGGSFAWVLDPEGASFVWFICWVFRSREKIICLGILDPWRGSVSEEVLEVWQSRSTH